MENILPRNADRGVNVRYADCAEEMKLAEEINRTLRRGSGRSGRKGRGSINSPQAKKKTDL